MIHGRRKQREPSTGQGSHERVGRDGAVGVHQVDVDDVAQPLQEDEHDTRSGRDAGEHLRHPGYVRGRGPGEPEEADREEEGADYHGEEALFGDGFSAVGDHFLLEACVGCVGYDGDADYDAEGYAEEGERADALVPASNFLECDGVGFEEEVEDAVDEGHVDCDEDEDGLERHHDEWAEDVFVDDVLHVDLLLIRGRMDRPILGLEAYSCCLAF